MGELRGSAQSGLKYSISYVQGRFVLKAVKKELLRLTSGSTAVRLVPPLNITKNQIDNVIQILTEIFAQ